jgi:hypothetical protein
MAANYNKPKYSSTEKAVQLVRVYLAMLSAALLIGWMHQTLLKPLKQEGLEMVRRRFGTLFG